MSGGPDSEHAEWQLSGQLQDALKQSVRIPLPLKRSGAVVLCRVRLAGSKCEKVVWAAQEYCVWRMD